MMKHTVIYDAAGTILCVMSRPVLADGWKPAHSLLEGQFALEVEEPVDPDGYFVDRGAVDVLKEKQPISATVDRPSFRVSEGCVITGIPPGSYITIEGNRTQIDDGMVELTFAYPGRYSVRIEAFPYLPLEVWLEVTP